MHGSDALASANVRGMGDSGGTGPGRPFRVLLAAVSLSNLADGIVKAALPLIAVGWTDSPLLISGVLATTTLPWLLLSLPAGLLVDRVDRRLAMIVAQVLRSLVLGLVALAVGGGAEQIWLLYLAGFALGTAETVHDTAAQSALPSLVDRERLEQANGRLSAAEVTTNTFAGPPLGGLLVGTAVLLGLLGPAGLWALAALLLLLLRRPAPDPGPERGPWHRELLDGLHFVRHHPVLGPMAVMLGVVNIATSAFLATLVVFVVGPGSPVGATALQYGLLLAAAGAGSLVGALATARLAARAGRTWVLAAALVAMAFFVGSPSLVDTLPLLGLAAVLGGAAVSAWNVITVAFRQRVTPGHLLGRVNAVYRLLAWGTIPLGALLGGALAELVGLRPMFAVSALVATVPVVALLRVNEGAMRRAEEGPR